MFVYAACFFGYGHVGVWLHVEMCFCLWSCYYFVPCHSCAFDFAVYYCNLWSWIHLFMLNYV